MIHIPVHTTEHMKKYSELQRDNSSKKYFFNEYQKIICETSGKRQK